MLNIACVEWGNYLGRGREYVQKLFAGVGKHLPKEIEARFVCLTDDASGLPEGVVAKALPDGPIGWWNLLCNFQPGMFPAGERVLFFDLDTIVTGDLTDIAGYSGRFAMLRDIYYPEHCGSGVMAFEAGAADEVWTRFAAAGMPMFDPGGDQRWTEAVMAGKIDLLQDLYPGQLVSYKKDCRPLGRLPDDARVLIFHGEPRPHASGAAWVDALWEAG